MNSFFGFVVGLLQSTLSLLGFVQQHPELPVDQKQQVQQVAEQAITQANNALSAQTNQASVSSKQNGLCIDLTQTLTIGSTDAQYDGEVHQLQTFLSKEGVYPEGMITGTFDQATSRAVQNWQTAHGISLSGNVAVVGPKTRLAMMQNCAGIRNVDPNTPITIMSPKAGDTVVSGTKANVQISFSKSFSDKVDGLLAAGNTFAAQPLSMGLLSERTGEIMTLSPIDGHYFHSDVIDHSDIHVGAYTYPFIPRTAMVSGEWQSHPNYLPPGRYKVVVNTRNEGSQNAIGRVYVEGDWFTISSGNQAGISFQVTSPTAGQVFTKGSTLPLRWSITGSDSGFVPKYFYASLLSVGPDNTPRYQFTASGTLCSLTTTYGGIAIPPTSSLDWMIPTAGTGESKPMGEQTATCDVTGVKPGKYQIEASINDCSGVGCMSQTVLQPSDSSGVFEIR
jgi:hypothetical protein